MILNVVEVFDSMQGEGEWMGTYCTFIRLPGCNYRCPFCDTDFSKAEIVLDTYTAEMQRHVVITGGEPTIHPRITELCLNLMNKGHIVHVETNGTHVAALPEGVWITVSPKREEWMKAPEHVTDWWNNLARIRELKLVVDEGFDPEAWSDKIPPTIPVWLQPCDGPYLEESKIRITEIIKQYPEVFRAGIQLHKWYEVQ